MNTQTLPQKQNFKSYGFIGLMMLALLAFNPIYGQAETKLKTEVATKERTIKGIVSDNSEALLGVNVVQEGTQNGTVTNKKGEFTFPKKLKTGDVLLFSYLGYVTQKVKIKDDTTFITLKLSEEMVEMIGALDCAEPYKSKRKN